MVETQNNQSKEVEQVGLNLVSETLPQIIENSASSKMEVNPVTTTEDNDDPKANRLTSKFANEELNLADLDEVLSKTIFEDTESKRILFLVCTLTYTDDHQKNAILTGPSSVGKTYNIKEILWYFSNGGQNPTTLAINDATPRSLIYSPNAVDVDERTLETIDFSKAPKRGDAKELFDEWYDLQRHKAKYIDLSNKILVFYDIPNYQLLTSLRSLLSHDEQVCRFLVTSKDANGSHKSKTVLIKGYFTAVFASANSTIDEQESSRTFLLSPTDSEEKIKKAIELQGNKLVDPNFTVWYETEPSRVGLKQRIGKIRNAKISNVLFQAEDMKTLQDWFFKNTANLGPRAQRDFPRLLSIAQAWALLNFQNRARTVEEFNIYANSTDIEVAKTIYEPVLKCNEIGLTPEEYEVWKMIDDTFQENAIYVGTGLKITEIHNVYYYGKKRRCSDKRLREMLKNFCSAGLLKEEKDGVAIKYYPITHKDTKQQEVAKNGDGANKPSPLFKGADEKRSTGVAEC